MEGYVDTMPFYISDLDITDFGLLRGPGIIPTDTEGWPYSNRITSLTPKRTGALIPPFLNPLRAPNSNLAAKPSQNGTPSNDAVRQPDTRDLQSREQNPFRFLS